MLKKFKKLSIAAQLWIVAIIIIFIICSIFISAYSMISQSLIHNNIVYTTQVFKQIQANIKNKSILLENLLQNTGYKKYVFEHIIETNNSKKYDQSIELQNSAVSATQVENNIQEVVIEGYNGTDYYSNGKTTNIEKALQSIPKKPTNYFHFAPGLSYKENGTHSFILSTTLYDIWKITSKSFAGRISFVVDMDIFGISDFTDEYGMGLFLLDKDYNMCASNKPTSKAAEQILKKIKTLKSGERAEYVANNDTYIINYDSLPSINGYILSVTPKSKIINSISWIRSIICYLLILTVILISFMFMLFKYNLTSPLKKLGVYMQEIKSGNVQNLNKQVNLNGYKEIEEISDQFNKMIAKINSLTHHLFKTMETLYETELEKKQSELLYLKSQINPHFLYNTLEVILGMSFLEKAPQTAEMIKCLSKIFKYSIKGEDTVCVQNELEIAKSYIHIQQTRFDGIFDVSYEFEDRILSNKIPKMLLQPIIENSITHGFENKNKDNKGHIEIGGKIDKNGKTKLWVEDDGIGLNEERLGLIQSILSKKMRERTDCIGFENVINRLQLIYGEQCEISVDSEIDVGTRVEITIP